MTLEKLTMDLILAINNEDLISTKEIINIINTMSLNSTEIATFVQLLSLTAGGGNYTNPLDNKCIDYIFENFIYEPKYKYILFYRKRLQMRKETDDNKIEEYIKYLFENENNNYAKDRKDFIQTLIELIAKLKDKEKKVHYYSLIKDNLE